MKIGVLTFHRSHNYGAYLQAYALVSFLNQNGYSAEIIDYNMTVAQREYEIKTRNPFKRYYALKRYKAFSSSINLLPKSKDSIVSDNISDFTDFIKGKYDVIIAGSDEIWKVGSYRKFPNPYWLPEIGEVIRISYAASSRSELSNLDEANKKKLCELLKSFSVIGVRDNYTFSELSKILPEDTAEKMLYCCDPTFLYEFDTSIGRGAKTLLKRANVDEQKKTLLIMTDDDNLAKSIRKTFKDKVNLVAVYRPHLGYKNLMDLSPFEWVEIIKTADVFVTKYFHGVCFSLKKNTQFIAVDSREKKVENGKIYDLLEGVGLLDHFLTTQNADYISKTIELVKKYLNETEVDFSSCIAHEKEKSVRFFELMKQCEKQ